MTFPQLSSSVGFAARGSQNNWTPTKPPKNKNTPSFRRLSLQGFLREGRKMGSPKRQGARPHVQRAVETPGGLQRDPPVKFHGRESGQKTHVQQVLHWLHPPCPICCKQEDGEFHTQKVSFRKQMVRFGDPSAAKRMPQTL